MNLSNFTIEDAHSLTEPMPPYYWDKQNLTVIRDGYLDCGTRIHVVVEAGYEIPVMRDNAIIISEDEELFLK